MITAPAAGEIPVGQCEQKARGKGFKHSHNQHCRAINNDHCKTNRGEAAGTSHSHQHPSRQGHCMQASPHIPERPAERDGVHAPWRLVMLHACQLAK